MSSRFFPCVWLTLILVLATANRGDSADVASLNVRDFGAKGDGKAKDHVAIQAAVDKCATRGGGTVLVPSGNYLCGTVELKSHTRLHLEVGAVLLGSPDADDYRKLLPGDNYHVGNPNQPHNRDQGLVVARKATDVGITGPGRIDARGHQFYNRDKANALGKFAVGKWRPGPTVLFLDCSEVRLDEFHLKDNPFFAVNLVGCTAVRITDLRITTDVRFQNADGVHVTCCRGVSISGCHIDSEDDALCFFTHHDGITDARPECSGVTVSNCVLASTWSGVRIGYAGDGIVRDMTFTNLVIPKAFKGIDFISTARNTYKGEKAAAGPSVSDLVFSNIVIRDSEFGISANVLPDAVAPGGIRDLLFSGMKVRSRRGNYLVGSKAVPIAGLAFRDVDFTVTGELDKRPAEIPDPLSVFGFRTVLPHALFVRHAEDIAFRDCRIRWEGATGDWGSALHVVNAREIDCRRLRADSIRKDGKDAITAVESEVRLPDTGR